MVANYVEALFSARDIFSTFNAIILGKAQSPLMKMKGVKGQGETERLPQATDARERM